MAKKQAQRVVNNATKTERIVIKYTMESKVQSLAVKVYEEQLVDGWDAFVRNVMGLNPEVIQVIAIKHYKDRKGDDIFEPAYIKPHIHIWLRYIKRDGVHKSQRVRTILKMLGIVFREGIDDELWKNKGVESCGDFRSCALYATHDTPRAREDGKEIYAIDEIVTNLPREELLRIRGEYVPSRKKDWDEYLEDMDKAAYAAGYAFVPFPDWWQSQPMAFRAKAKKSVFEDTHEYGRVKHAEELFYIGRVCVFIEGDPATGKTYTSTQALKALGKRVYEADGGGTGKFDRLTEQHDAIVLSDDTAGNLLNLCDSKIAQTHRRNKDNPYYIGDFFVVTWNESFDDWLDACGFTKKRHLEAMHSRFFVCKMGMVEGKQRLILEKPSTRGTEEQVKEKMDKFEAFREKFDELIADYVPKDEAVVADLPRYYTPDQVANLIDAIHLRNRELRDLKDSLDGVHDYYKHEMDKRLGDLPDSIDILALLKHRMSPSEWAYYGLDSDCIPEYIGLPFDDCPLPPYAQRYDRYYQDTLPAYIEWIEHDRLETQ